MFVHLFNFYFLVYTLIMNSYQQTQQTQLKIQKIIREINSLCEEFTHKEYLEGFIDMRKLFVLI